MNDTQTIGYFKPPTWRERFWPWLGFRGPGRHDPGPMPGYAEGHVFLTTDVILSWRDRLRLLITGHLRSCTSLKTDVHVTKSMAFTLSSVMPPGHRPSYLKTKS